MTDKRGPGRPPLSDTEPSVRLETRMPASLALSVREAAATRDEGVSEWLRDAAQMRLEADGQG